MSGYLPRRIFRSHEYEWIFELERKLGRRPEVPRSPATRIAWHIAQVR